MIGVDPVRCHRSRDGERDITQVGGLFDAGAGAIVFANQLRGLVVDKEQHARVGSDLLHPLIEPVIGVACACGTL